MKLTIENQGETGAVDYTSTIDLVAGPKIERKLNQPSLLRCKVVPTITLPVPVAGARVVLSKANGDLVFTGYLTRSPVFEFQGLSERAGSFVFFSRGK